MYIDELRIDRRQSLHLSSTFRKRLSNFGFEVMRGGFVIFQKNKSQISLSFLTQDKKSELISNGKFAKHINGQYIDEIKIDTNWNMQLSKRIKESLDKVCEKDDFLIFYYKKKKLCVELEKYDERKKRREANS